MKHTVKYCNGIYTRFEKLTHPAGGEVGGEESSNSWRGSDAILIHEHVVV